MKAIIFAGGVGTRLWPLSRRKSPKQFEKVIGDKSTLQLAVERLQPYFKWEDIFVATHERYVSIVSKQLPKLLPMNIIGEPESRDVGPAVGLATSILYKKYANEPVVIIWSDHLVGKPELFQQLLLTCNRATQKTKNKIIFISQKPRFASQNLGWIKYGKVAFKENNFNFYTFESFHYRPDINRAKEFLQDGSYTWNLGYFVTTLSFLWSMYQKHQPDIFRGLKEIYNSVGSSQFKAVVSKVYPKFPKVSFDSGILENIDSDNALVISEDLKWSDIGAWEALKEALQTSPDKNVSRGKVLVTDCRDSLVYNYSDQLVVTIDLDGFIVINTDDVVLICHKHSVPKIKKLVEKLAESKNDHLV